MTQRIPELDRLPHPRKGAYFGDKAKKAVAVNDMIESRKTDALLKGKYGTIVEKGRTVKFRGCAVGCGLMSAELRKFQAEQDHKLTRKEITEFQKNLCVDSDPHERLAFHHNISEELAHLEDHIFETLPLSDAKKWPVQFLRAIPVGANLNGVVTELCTWLNKTHPNWVADRLYGSKVRCADDIASVILRWLDDPYMSNEDKRDRTTRSRAVRSQLLKLLKDRAPKA